MWLILTALAAIVTTVIWYVNAPEDKYKVGLLSLAFWGATLMWLVDHVMAYLTEGGEFFELSQDATMLGVSVILVALVIWLFILLIGDPKGVLRKVMHR
jgi:peptidoglycan biosynthesis protein MviN/MurJ (putative lipid II flippase)